MLIETEQARFAKWYNVENTRSKGCKNDSNILNQDKLQIEMRGC